MAAESTQGGARPPVKLRAKVPVAQPADPGLKVAATAEEEEFAGPFFSVQTFKGFATSFALHGALLLVLAFWYFAPARNPPKVFDTRLAGSDMGVPDGLTNTGGLNSELEMPKGPSTTAPELTTSVLQPLEIAPMVLSSKNLAGADRATVGGGMNNNNPGAGSGDGFGLARFGSGGESIRGVEVKVGDPQFTLLWDNDVDLDLHVIEPGGKEIYWEDPKGAPGLGGELDVDNTKGFGPENVYWVKEDGETKVPGPGPPGVYKWFVVYWGGFGGVAKPTHWKVRIKHDGKVTIMTGRFKALNERSKEHTLVIDPKDRAAAETTPPP